jgi:AAA domain
MAARSRTKPPSTQIAAMKKRITKPGAGKWVKICAYGPNGSGKTRFAASAPKVLIIDINEEGDRSAKNIPGVRVIRIKKWEDIGVVYWYLESGDHPFESVAIDTVTKMHEMAMSFVLGEAEYKDLTRVRAMPQRKDWNRSGQLVKTMGLAFRNLPMHVIFTAQERKIRDDDTQEILERTVDLPAGARGTILDSVGIIGRMIPRQVRVKDSHGKRKKIWVDHLVVGKHEIMVTKDRTGPEEGGLLAPIIRRPTMDQIIHAWNS